MNFMNKKYQKIWELTKPQLRKGKIKDFVLHTEGVVKATEMILEKEKGDAEILIPSAILHDVGWAKVPVELQNVKDRKKENKKIIRKALELHIEFAPEIINKILTKLGYDKKIIRKIIDVVKDHKFKNPRDLNKRILIDADVVGCVFREQFYSDAKSYKNSPKENYEIRKKDDKFYTKTAKEIFEREMRKREKEVSN
jgi:hypothetical protein